MHEQAEGNTRATAKPCEVHANHTPRSHVNEIHHVWPLGEGGPDIPENKVVVCATGHNSIHQLMSLWLKGAAEPPWSIRRQYTPDERRLAQTGYDRIKRQAM
jgi:hypothetical protein